MDEMYISNSKYKLIYWAYTEEVRQKSLQLQTTDTTDVDEVETMHHGPCGRNSDVRNQYTMQTIATNSVK